MFIIDFWDSIFTFLDRYSWEMIVATFWFFFIIEVPRYYILDIFVIAYWKIRHKHFRRQHDEARLMLFSSMPFVTILVPGKNEGEHIFKLANSLSEQTYTNFEIIIVDDGSDDFTPEICRDLERQGRINRYLRNDERGGKASAANMGLHYTKGKYIIHLDADSSLDRNAIEEILIPFYIDPKIKAVGGCVKVRNKDKNICTSMQALEYLETIMVGRVVTSTLGIYRTVSGAFGAFETEVIRQVGGWDIGPGLDGDITQKFRKSGAKIYFAPLAVCLTNAPTSFFALRNQRLRWSKSLIRFRVRKHIDVLLPTQNFNFSNFFSNLENIIFNLAFDVTWLIYVIGIIVTNKSFILELLFLKFCIMTIFSLISFLVVMAVTERRREEFSLIILVPFMTFYTGMYLRVVRIQAYLKEIFFFSSYKDEWNPDKSSKEAEFYGI